MQSSTRPHGLCRQEYHTHHPPSQGMELISLDARSYVLTDSARQDRKEPTSTVNPSLSKFRILAVST